MKIKLLIGTVFVFYLILMIGFNEPASALYEGESNGALELTHISGPGVVLHDAEGIF